MRHSRRTYGCSAPRCGARLQDEYAGCWTSSASYLYRRIPHMRRHSSATSVGLRFAPFLSQCSRREGSSGGSLRTSETAGMRRRWQKDAAAETEGGSSDRVLETASNLSSIRMHVALEKAWLMNHNVKEMLCVSSTQSERVHWGTVSAAITPRTPSPRTFILHGNFSG